MANNIHGLINEDDFRNYINSHKTFDSYNINIKYFLELLYKKDLSGIKFECIKIGGSQKPDVKIICKFGEKNISIKKGSGNSVHQEKFEEFVSFLYDLNISERTIENLKLFHYGDDTIDDTGIVRYSATECKYRYSNEIYAANIEFNQSANLYEIINRVLFVGNCSAGDEVDAIYYGSFDHGLWATRKEIENYFLTNHFDCETIHFASLTYQVWDGTIILRQNIQIEDMLCKLNGDKLKMILKK